MPIVNADASELLQTLKDMQTAISSIEVTKTSMARRYHDLANCWKDKKYDELGNVVQECTRALQEILKTLTKGEKYVAALAKSLGEYERTNLTSGSAQYAFAENTTQEGTSNTTNATDNAYIAAAMRAYGFAGNVDFGNLDAKTSRDIFKSVAETLQMFPDLDLSFVGSAQARNTHIQNSLTQMYLNTYRQHYPDATDEELMPFVQQQVTEDMNGLAPGDRTIAQSLFIREPQTYVEQIISAFNGISINESYGGDYDHFVEVRRQDVLHRWKPEGCATPQATVDHELGHQIAHLTDAHNDAYIQDLYRQFTGLTGQQRGETLSGYAGESIHEFIAEAWSEYRNNPNCRPLAREIANRIFDLYNQNTHQQTLIRR